MELPVEMYLYGFPILASVAITFLIVFVIVMPRQAWRLVKLRFRNVIGVFCADSAHLCDIRLAKVLLGCLLDFGKGDYAIIAEAPPHGHGKLASERALNPVDERRAILEKWKQEKNEVYKNPSWADRVMDPLRARVKVLPEPEDFSPDAAEVVNSRYSFLGKPLYFMHTEIAYATSPEICAALSIEKEEYQERFGRIIKAGSRVAIATLYVMDDLIPALNWHTYPHVLESIQIFFEKIGFIKAGKDYMRMAIPIMAILIIFVIAIVVLNAMLN